MATFRRGLDAEDRICTKLEGFGCRIQRDPRLDHKHKLDFVITNYIDNPNFYSFGVQITTKLDQLEKQEEFLKANQASRVTTKALYLELSDKVDLEDGGALAVLSVILDFQFNRSYSNVRLSAARIYDDLTYQFYDLAARVKQLHERADEQHWRIEQASPGAARSFGASSVTPIDSATTASGVRSVPAVPVPFSPAAPVSFSSAAATHACAGVVTSYVRQGGHGVIQGEGETRYFFHVSHVADEALREHLNGLPYATTPIALELAVIFSNAGLTKPGARYPEARGVRLRMRD